jgi:hypothetical protein
MEDPKTSHPHGRRVAFPCDLAPGPGKRPHTHICPGQKCSNSTYSEMLAEKLWLREALASRGGWEAEKVRVMEL